MILIADSGSTKTTWCLADKGKRSQQIETKGMNPFFQDEKDMTEAIADKLLPYLGDASIDEVFFYGAGCTPEKSVVVEKVLIQFFKRVTVNSDMLAAARAQCGREAGIIGILGTGSNSCFYDGKTITANVSPLGYILGDEGSGAVLGKLLVGDVLKNQLPESIKDQFLAQYRLTPAEIIDRVYRQAFPNRFLASLSPFLAQHLNEPALFKLAADSFKAYFTRNIMQYDYKHHVTHLIGSVAWYYQEVLRSVGQELHIEIGKIDKSPMEGLISYHNQA